MSEEQLLNTEQFYLRRLIEKTEEELINIRVQCFIYLRESLNPKHIGKAEAEEKLGQYQKREKYLEENIQVYYEYAKHREYENL